MPPAAGRACGLPCRNGLLALGLDVWADVGVCRADVGMCRAGVCNLGLLVGPLGTKLGSP